MVKTILRPFTGNGNTNGQYDMKNVLICNQISINLRSVRSMPNKMTDGY